MHQTIYAIKLIVNYLLI